MIIVESDDLCPESLWKFNKFWKPLKEKHPNLKITFWVPAKWGDKEENDISKNESFKKWFDENKGWCEVHPHGLTHAKPPEFLRSDIEQAEIFEKLITSHWHYISRNTSCITGFKAPFYRMNKTTLELLDKHEFDFYVQWWHIIPLKLINRGWGVSGHIYFQPHSISSHTSPEGEGNTDDISEIYEDIDKQLTYFDKFGYLTIGEYIASIK